MADIYDQLLDEQTPQNSTAQPMQVAANEPDVYDKLLDEVQSGRRAAVDASIQQAVKVAPQQAATVQQLAKSTGLPTELVERNFDAVQTQAKIRQMQSLMSASPLLQRQMADPNFAKLAQSDLGSLGLFERTYRGLGGGATEAVGRTIGGVGELTDIVQRNLTQAFANTFLPDAVDGSRPDPNSLVGPRIAEGWQQTGDIVKDAARDFMVPALQQTFYDQVAAGLGQVSAQILAAVLTGGMTSVMSLYAQGADVMADMVENDPASQGMKDLAVLGGAAITGITEKWALDRILGPMAVPIQNQLGAALARIGIAGLSEGGQEALESIGQDALRQFLTNPEAEIRLGEALDEGAVGATVGAIVRTVVESAAGVRARHVRLENQAAQAEQNAATLEQLNQIAAADELLKISPETFEQFVAAAAEDGPVQAVYIDAQTLMQSGVADQLAQLSPSVQEQLAVAAATNGTVQIPIAEYASKIAPTEYAQSLLDHLKTDPQGFSRAEARDYLQTQQQQLEQDVEQALQMKADDAVFMESQQKVKDLVLNELNTLGRFTPQKNELDATLIAARSAVRAAQLGMTPEAFFESQRLRFTAERIDGETFNQDNDPDLRQLAEFYAQDDEYQFDNFQEREDAINALVSRYGSDDNFSGMQLPDGTGTITVTPSSKEPGKWQVTMFDRDMVPSADNGLQSKEDALRYFFEQARPSPELFQFAGSRAITADMQQLERAFALEARGVTSASIQRETGWYRGVDGRWRFEISDDRAAFKEDSIDMAALEREADRYIDIQPSGELFRAVYEDGPITNYLGAYGRTGEDARNNLLNQLAKRQFGTPFNINNVKEGDSYKLSDVLTHPELFAAYPEMAELTVEFKKDTDYFGAYIESDRTIDINIDRSNDEMLSTLLHEIQHAIQAREDFARGGATDQRFAQSVKDALTGLTQYQQERVDGWKRLNSEKLATAEGRAEVARNALMYESAQRLIDYSNRDKPSGVFRLIRNEMQWIYGEQFYRNDQARDLQRRFYDIPKRGDKRNAFIRDMAFDAAQFLLDNIPAEQRQQFKSDTRTMKGMINALQREATKAREALNPLREIEKTARAAKDVAEATRYKGPYEVYRALAGEIEARTTQARQRLTSEERRNRPVRSDMDVDPSEAIVVIGGRELLAPTVMMDSMQEFNQGGLSYVQTAEDINVDEDLQALASELLDNGAQITPDGRVRLFHRTNEQAAQAIRTTGSMTGKEDGLFFSTSQDGQTDGFGDAVVELHIPLDQLQLDDVFGNEAHVRVPLQRAGQRLNVGNWLGEFNQGASRARGAYNPNTNTIALLKNADLSTFLHEAGHYFFESDINLAAEIVRGNRMLGDDSMTQGEQDILRDVSQLLDWHGLKGDINAQLDQWFNLSFEEKRAYHEKTAESFERYLFEGTAPSIELQPYFQQFRAWLLSVYKSIKDFLTRNPAAGELTDEVRIVFDRMLATTEQIQLAQQARSMMPLFRTQAEADNVGMTPEEFAAYQAQDTEASNDAIKDLEAKGLRDLQWTRNARNREIKKLQRKSAELRREARIEARADVLSEPVYRAWQFLTGKLQDTDRITPVTPRKSDPNTVDPTVDSMFTAMAKLGGINKQAVVETWGVEDSERPNSGVFGKPVLRREGGRTIDEMAELLAEQGYVQTDADGKAIVEDFELKFDSELRGEPSYSLAYDYSQDDAARLRPGEQVNILALGAGRLDLDSLREYDLTEDQLKLLKSYRMTATSGLHPDLVAELPGVEMSSGDELVRRLLDATPLGEEIEARTDAIMLERYGELATPEAIEREADKAIHNEARARMVATEANALARATGQRKVLTQAARQFAQAMVARSKVRDVKPSTYASAEARAAKAAEKASRAGDLTLAAAEKRNQLVNTYAAKAAYDALEQVDVGLRYLRKFEREGSRKGLDVEYLDQIDTLLERFDLRKGQSLRAIDKRTTLAQWVAAQEQAGLEPDIPDYIMAEANRTSYKNLTVEEFQGMVDSVKQIEHLGRLKKKLLTAKDQRELDAIVGDITARIEQSADGRVVDNEVRDTVGSKLAYFGRWIGAAHRKAASVVRELDGLTDGGPMWDYFMRTMNEAGDREASMRADASKRLHELAKPVLDGESMGGKGRFFPSLNRSLNRGERLAIALNWGNESNRQRLLGGKGWTAAQMQPVLNSLTSTEWTFVQGVWDFFESYRPEIAAKERRVYGKEPDWIAPAAFEITTADGQRIQVRGGYYPIKYDPKQSGKAGEFAEAEDAKAMMRAAYTAATTRRSFTKGRVEEVQGRPLLLTFDGIWQGANEVIHDLTWHEWLIDANRLLRRLDSPIRTGFGAEYMEILRKAVKDAARGDQPAANLVEKSLTHIRNGSTIVGMGWNITTALMQPLGYTNSVVRIGGKWMARGLSEFFGSPRHMIEKAEEVQAMSPMMRTRMMTMNREINDVRNRLTSDRSELRERIEGSYFIMIQKLQAMVDYPTWLGAYAKAIDDPANLNADGTINEARAAALADQAVLDAQGGGQIKDLAEVQRGNPLLKLFTNFYSYFNVLYNLTTEQTKKRVKAKEYAGLMGDYLLLMVVPAVLSAIIRNAVKGEDDEDEYVKAIASELVGYPFGMFVGLREVAGAAQLAAGVGNPAFGYSGPAGLRFFSEMNKLGVQVGQGELDMALFKSANNVGGLMFHYPASQVNRAVEGSAALIDGETQNPLAPFVGVNRN